MNEQLVNVTEAQKLLRVSKKKIAALLAEGSIPYQVDILDKRVKLVRLEDVKRLIELRLGKAA
ncbi:MAG: hypothetical protein QOH96_2744 [Blastocatellia bacterium]|jgi:hypothetical protein|nr:hypothetical protein [Blastocatellia bacterium]